MQKIVKAIIIFFVLVSCNVLISTKVNADFMNPEFLTKRCGEGEKEITCGFNSVKPFGERVYDGCSKYATNPNYYYLVGHGSSFGGDEKYCLKVGEEDNAIIEEMKNNKLIIGGIFVGSIIILSTLVLVLIRKKNANK